MNHEESDQRDSSKTGKRSEESCTAVKKTWRRKGNPFWLPFHGEVKVLGHSLLSLCDRVSLYDLSFKSFRKRLKPMEGYYVDTRYPNSIEGSYIPSEFFDEEDVKRAFPLAREVLNFVQKRIEGGKR